MFNYNEIHSPKQVRKLSCAPPAREEDGAQLPPPDLIGGWSFVVDWVTVTVWMPVKEALQLYDNVFLSVLGDLQDQDRGGLGYARSKLGLGNFKFYYDPKGGDERVTWCFPGQACKGIIPEFWIEFNYEISKYKHAYKRIDFAWDGVPFGPVDFFEAIKAGRVRSLAKRESLSFIDSPFKLRDDDSEMGCHTAYFGSRTSQRMIRVYDRRGITRAEMECKQERAQLVAVSLFTSMPERWFELAISHLRDFLDIRTEWWDLFVGSVQRAFAKVTDLRRVALEKIISWVDTQVAPSLSVLVDTLGDDLLEMIVRRGRKRRSMVYSSLVSAFSGG
jgi:DNA relaxase NicK